MATVSKISASCSWHRLIGSDSVLVAWLDLHLMELNPFWHCLDSWTDQTKHCRAS